MNLKKKETKEAIFAHHCDKLECDLQAKLYDEENCVDLESQYDNYIMEDSLVKELLSSGKTWGQMWLKFGQVKYDYDKNFMNISNYALENKISICD